MKKQRLEQKLNQSLSPRQIQFLGLLQLPVLSLEKRIEEELEENPILEEEEEEEEENEGSFHSSKSKLNFEEFQIESAEDSFEDYLSKQLIDLNLPENTLFLVNYLINSLDDSGFLSQDLYSISSDLLTNNNIEVTEKNLKEALRILQSLEPVGIGAKSLQKCLLIQLEKLHPSEEIAFQILSEYYIPFSNKNFEHIMKALSISQKELKSVYHLIENLSPFPAAGFSRNTTTAKYIYPDFTININNKEAQLQINNGNTKTLKLSAYYSNLLLETTDKKTKDFLNKKLEKAKWFKESIEKRKSTLKKVMGAIMTFQKAYLQSGLEGDLKPMKLANIAEIINMDISTVSRVSSSKFVQTHFGTFKVKELFSDAFRKDNGQIISTSEIKRQLKEIVLNENKLNPLTDEKISELLGKEEYNIARRTVAKYREQLGIETAKLRRRL